MFSLMRAKTEPATLLIEANRRPMRTKEIVMPEIINPEEPTQEPTEDETPSKRATWGRRGVALAIAAAIVLLAAGVAGGGLLFGGSHSSSKKPASNKGVIAVGKPITGTSTVMSRWDKIVAGPSTETRGCQCARQIVSATVHVLPGYITWVAQAAPESSPSAITQFTGRSIPTDSYISEMMLNLPEDGSLAYHASAGYYALIPQAGLPVPEQMPDALVHPTIVAEKTVNDHRIWSVIVTQQRALCANSDTNAGCGQPGTSMLGLLNGLNAPSPGTPPVPPAPACASPHPVPQGQQLWCVMLGGSDGLVMWPAEAGIASNYRWPGYPSSYEGVTTSTPPLVATPN
jgi:hypothetical protein